MKRNERTEAIKKSIAHWQANVDRLKEWDASGEEISSAVDGKMYVWYTRNSTVIEPIFYDSLHCDLCKTYKYCQDCPLSNIEQHRCKHELSPWRACYDAETNKEIIKAAENMLLALQSLLINTHIYKEHTMPKCEIVIEDSEDDMQWIVFRADGECSTDDDPSTGWHGIETEMKEVYMWVDNDNWIEVTPDMIPDKMWDKIDNDWSEYIRNNPPEQMDADTAGDIELHMLRDEGRI